MKIFYENEEIQLKGDGYKNLLRLCLKNKIDISHSCDGMASCGTCRVVVTSCAETLSPRNELEEEIANDRNYAPEERLACQLEIHKNSRFSFRIPE